MASLSLFSQRNTMTKFWLYLGIAQSCVNVPSRLIASYPRTAFVLWMLSLILALRF